uniref:Uncharacterized protein n=1 Tax=Prymnesium polylepis TaxID=72548 RepID=A0A7S4HF34_9EUKA
MTGGDVLPEAARYTYLAKIDGDVNFTVSLPLARALQQQPPIKVMHTGLLHSFQPSRCLAGWYTQLDKRSFTPSVSETLRPPYGNVFVVHLPTTQRLKEAAYDWYFYPPSWRAVPLASLGIEPRSPTNCNHSARALDQTAEHTSTCDEFCDCWGDQEFWPFAFKLLNISSEEMMDCEPLRYCNAFLHLDGRSAKTGGRGEQFRRGHFADPKSARCPEALTKQCPTRSQLASLAKPRPLWQFSNGPQFT